MSAIGHLQFRQQLENSPAGLKRKLEAKQGELAELQEKTNQPVKDSQPMFGQSGTNGTDSASAPATTASTQDAQELDAKKEKLLEEINQIQKEIERSENDAENSKMNEAKETPAFTASA